MKRFALLLVLSLMIAGCNQAEETPKQVENQAAQPDAAGKEADLAATGIQPSASGSPGSSPSSAPEQQGEAVSFQVVGSPENSVRPDQGNLQVSMQATVEEKDGYLVVKGTSNLLSGAKVSGNVDAEGYAMFGYSDTAEVDPDGSFQLFIKKPNLNQQVELTVTFNPKMQIPELQQHYGENGDKLQGDAVYQYQDDDKSIKKKVELKGYFHPRKDHPLKLALEMPKWEKPADYGSPEVWIKPELRKDERLIYVHATSNLLEGSQVTGGVEIPGYVTFGYSATKYVNPDGSFDLSIPYPKDSKNMYVELVFKPREDAWQTVKENYGEKGEKLAGKWVKTDSDGSKQIYLKLKLDTGE
ncbi:hypothetical protein G3578_08895 [Brevibacillus sp. SYP-B805]|uniref:hypothetical protein n=1 Tax=Brevibacillus sp. SYP-B805 TaxID=1578199 RepID=UPI0013EE0B5E|nr:hypothetical protein [Brevibacillus sp. SYP-B805]NGQ95285.1 hypothetical protein [Brevibacillus sp. SYP-B805]